MKLEDGIVVAILVLILFYVIRRIPSTEKYNAPCYSPMKRFDYPHGQWRMGTGPLAMKMYKGN